MIGDIYKHINGTITNNTYIILMSENYNNDDSSFVIIFDNLNNYQVGDQTKLNYDDYILTDWLEVSKSIYDMINI